MTPTKIKNKSKHLQTRFSQEIWVRDTPETPVPLRLAKGTARWGYLLFHGFFKDQCIIRAAALTFTTILSIVPFLAVAFSISKGFGLQNTEFIRTMVLRMSTGNTEVADKIIQYIDRTNVQTLGWIGIAMLLFTVFSLIGTIEKAFNTIWSVQRGRTAWRKVTDFFPVIFICPIFLLVASSFNVSLQKQEIIQGLLSVSAIGYVEALILKLAPLMLIIIAFSFMYAFIPNTRVKITSALLGGLVGGVLWQLAQWVYINWQIGAAKYNAIYGSFAQFPLLLMWIYISWVVVLLGSEAGYAWQNINSFVKQRFFGAASALERQKIAVIMMSFLAKRFHNGEPLPSVEDISDRLMVPAPLVSDLFEVMRTAGLTVRTDSVGCEVYAPARALDAIRLVDIIGVVNSEGGGKTGGIFKSRFQFIDGLFEGMRRDVEKSDANLTLLESAQRLHDDPVNAGEVGDACGEAAQGS
ncbi:YhjD/YihY/BrkB family envelope integrity protein [Salidesulfovibrio onnuriiensis]|uniref:YhjD/YihY/BrkB family envelope integrity protein n=1 Tax=Salidesulfovibrio onnuriiensis TaxID=2583823 RepID=UPI0011CBEA90|nr:YhjD/YihY/BrkB family envelope integrity protein [Salidesulfovibrio onnuriiensis]